MPFCGHSVSLSGVTFEVEVHRLAVVVACVVIILSMS